MGRRGGDQARVMGSDWRAKHGTVREAHRHAPMGLPTELPGCTVRLKPRIIGKEDE